MTQHLTIPQVAERWHCSPRYVWSLTASKALPCLYLGRLVRIRESDLERYEADRIEGGNGSGQLQVVHGGSGGPRSSRRA